MSSVNGRPQRSAAPPSTALSSTALPATVDELARRLKPEMKALNPRVSWTSMFPVADEDLRQYLHEPVEALPPAVSALLPKVAVVLAPYLERPALKGVVSVVAEKPAEPKLVFTAIVISGDAATIFLTVKDEQVADYHYGLYDELAGLLATRLPAEVQEKWHGLLREELSGEVHGEVDERSWHEKQSLLRRPVNARRDGKPFRDYARASFRDTMTLFMHGICCDIDVETGPRQLPSRYLRKRLEALKGLFPPPEGHAVFPEDLQPQ